MASCTWCARRSARSCSWRMRLVSACFSAWVKVWGWLAGRLVCLLVLAMSRTSEHIHVKRVAAIHREGRCAGQGGAERRVRRGAGLGGAPGSAVRRAGRCAGQGGAERR
eukprot:356906-Chlamydomonas_euryale.AAC.5